MRKLLAIGIGAVCLLALGAVPTQAATALDVISGCAQGGSNFGLEVAYDGSNTNAFLIDNTPTNETRHIVTVFMRLNTGSPFNFSMNAGDKHQVLRARSIAGTNTTVWRVHLRRQTGGPQLHVLALWVNLDSGSQFVGEKIVSLDQWQFFTIDWQASSSLGAGDGSAFINKGAGTPVGASGLDNFFDIDQQQLGAFAFSGSSTTPTGSACWDVFDSRRAP